MSMKKVILVGAGGHAAEIADYIALHNQLKPTDQIEIIGIIDDNKQNYHHYGFSQPFLGSIVDHVLEECDYLIGIANIEFRLKIVTKLWSQGAKFIGFIHPYAMISPSAKIGVGTVISHHASVGPKALIGKFNVLNSRCTIGHDAEIGDFNFISPNVSISGQTKIGSENLLGTNVCTIPTIEIGNNNKIAAGMVITDKITNNETVFYRYKEKMIAKGFNG